MSAIMKLRQARNVEQIAEELEPLAVSLATLADQAQASIKAMEDASQRQAQAWGAQQESAGKAVGAAALEAAQASALLKRAAEEVRQAQRGQLWTLVLLASTSAILAAALSTGLLLWLGWPK